MKSVEELKREALLDLQYDREQEVKREIKQTIQNIVSEQKKIAEATKKISDFQAHLKTIQLEEIKVEL